MRGRGGKDGVEGREVLIEVGLDRININQPRFRTEHD